MDFYNSWGSSSLCRMLLRQTGRKLLENYKNSQEDEVEIKSSNVVIIMAGMLCGLICMGGLFSMVRCAVRCRGRRVLRQSTHHILFPVLNRGLDKAALEALPVVEYSKGKSCAGGDCAICLVALAEGEKVRVLPNCDHSYHVRCIDPWFSTNSSCPSCRRRCAVEEKTSTPAQPCHSDNNQSSSAASVSTRLQGIACPVQYWNRNLLEPSIDRYLP